MCQPWSQCLVSINRRWYHRNTPVADIWGARSSKKGVHLVKQAGLVSPLQIPRRTTSFTHPQGRMGHTPEPGKVGNLQGKLCERRVRAEQGQRSKTTSEHSYCTVQVLGSDVFQRTRHPSQDRRTKLLFPRSLSFLECWVASPTMEGKGAFPLKSPHRSELLRVIHFDCVAFTLICWSWTNKCK